MLSCLHSSSACHSADDHEQSRLARGAVPARADNVWRQRKRAEQLGAVSPAHAVPQHYDREPDVVDVEWASSRYATTQVARSFFCFPAHHDGCLSVGLRPSIFAERFILLTRLICSSPSLLGLFPSPPSAPRVTISNGMVIPNYSKPSDYTRLYAMGNSIYGQMTAGR